MQRRYFLIGPQPPPRRFQFCRKPPAAARNWSHLPKPLSVPSRCGEVCGPPRQPTLYDKLTRASGDGAGLKVGDTPVGRVGQLICGENTNPLARYALMAQAEQIHISSWPALWPTRPAGNGTNYNNVEANRIRSSAHSFEAKAFGMNTAGFMDAAMRKFLVDRDPKVADTLDRSSRAASFFVDPTGAPVGDFLQDDEGIAYAEFDLDRCVEPKQYHDVTGYYNRFDVFSLTVNRKRQHPITFVDDAETLSQNEDDASFAEGKLSLHD